MEAKPEKRAREVLRKERVLLRRGVQGGSEAWQGRILRQRAADLVLRGVRQRLPDREEGNEEVEAAGRVPHPGPGQGEVPLSGLAQVRGVESRNQGVRPRLPAQVLRALQDHQPLVHRRQHLGVDHQAGAVVPPGNRPQAVPGDLLREQDQGQGPREPGRERDEGGLEDEAGGPQKAHELHHLHLQSAQAQEKRGEEECEEKGFFLPNPNVGDEENHGVSGGQRHHGEVR